MDKFVSIAVNQGDAFYLERSGVRILVDGGRAKLGFPVQFARTIGAETLDVVVCTHADADHINGLLGLFEAGYQVREIWLPGTWASRLRELLLEPEKFYTELIGLIDDVGPLAATNLEELYEDEIFHDLNRDWPQGEEAELDLELIDQAIEEAPEKPRFFGLGICPEWDEYWLHIDCRACRRLINDAIDTADKIRDLAILAFHSGAKIRWFEYERSGNASGGESHLKPVNAKEIFRISRRLNALMYLTISKANKESLVFYSPASDEADSVLFSADSDFSFRHPLPRLENNSIITAPHHGSEHNQKAYTRLDSEDCITTESIVVRSDGRFSKRPGVTYVKLYSKKICTLCRHPSVEKQDVKFTASSNGWKKEDGIDWCRCL